MIKLVLNCKITQLLSLWESWPESTRTPVKEVSFIHYWISRSTTWFKCHNLKVFSFRTTWQLTLWEWDALLAHLCLLEEVPVTPNSQKWKELPQITAPVWFHYHTYLYLVLHLFLTLSHLLLAFLSFLFPACRSTLSTWVSDPVWINWTRIKKNKSVLSEPTSHFEFPLWCYRQCIIYFKPAVRLGKKIQTTFSFQKKATS